MSMEMDRCVDNLILMTEHVSLHQYIDATMLGALIGDAVTIYCIFNFQIIFRGFFSLFDASRLITQYDSVRQKARRIIREKK